MPSKIDWKKVWDSALNSKEIFPVTQINNKSVSISCPTRFSSSGAFSIQITPTFKEYSIELELLTFNDNISLEDLPEISDNKQKNDFNALSSRLVKYELSNRLLERFSIKSNGFKDINEATKSLIDYINNKATESGRMFDDKLDELNDIISNNKSESYDRIVSSIKDNRKSILKKVESILKFHYKYKTSKNEEFGDSSIPLYNRNGELAAVVSVVDDSIVIDLAKGVTSKVSLLQSDKDIEKEIVADVDDANSVLAKAAEIEHLKNVVASNPESDMEDVYEVDIEDSTFNESLLRRVTRLENLYINSILRRFK